MRVEGVLFALAMLMASHLPTAFAEDAPPAHALELVSVQGEIAVANPGQVLTISFQVRNASANDDAFRAQVFLPAGWRAVELQEAFELKPQQTSVRLITLHIPASAMSGDYRVVYEANSQTQPHVRAVAAVELRVGGPRVQAELLDAPASAVEGEAFHVRFRVNNRGNSSSSIDYQATSALGSRIHAGTGSLTLKAGEAAEVEVIVTPGSGAQASRDWISLLVRSRDGAPTQTASASIRIMPALAAAQSSPLAVNARTVNAQNIEQARVSWQTELSGGGVLNEVDRSNVSFVMRTPQTNAAEPFANADEYHLEYNDPRSRLAVGDRVYALSPLTEQGRYGRGALMGQQVDKVGLSVYHVEDRSTVAPNPQSGMNLGYAVDERSRVSFNLLDKGDSNRVGGLRHQANWNQYLDTDVELADASGVGGQGAAARADLNGADDRLRYNLRMVEAAPDYNGAYRDTRQHAGSLEYNLSQRWRMRGSARVQRDNLDRDPTRPAPAEQQVMLGPDYRLTENTRVGLDFGGRRRTDEGSAPQFDVDNRGAQISVVHQLHSLNVDVRGGMGHSNDRLSGSTFATSLASLNAQWQASESSSYGVFAAYDDNTYSDRQQAAQTTFGLSLRFAVSSSTAVGMNAQRSGAGPTRTDMLNVSFERGQANGQRVALVARYSEGNAASTDLLLTYNVPFQVPTVRHSGPGGVRGRIYDLETGKGLSGVVVSLGGIAAVTDGQGAFTFPNVRPGTQYLFFARGDALAGKVSTRALPLAVDVLPGSVRVVELPLVRPARIRGQVIVYRSEQVKTTESGKPAGESYGSTDRVVGERGLGNAIIVLRQRDQTVRRLTDEDANFRVEGLTPGEWEVRLEREALPPDLELLEQPGTLFIAPGKEGYVTFDLQPKLLRERITQQNN